MTDTSDFGRADFSRATKSALAQSAGYHCVRPGCSRRTHIFDVTTRNWVHFGAAAHDIAASDTGPRADPDLSRDQRSAFENGAWLCMNCATIVDRLEAHFPPGTLPKWQLAAQQNLINGSLHPMLASNIPWPTAVANTKKFCTQLRTIRPYMSGRTVHGFSDEAMGKLDRLRSDCHLLQQADHPMTSMYTHTLNLQLRILHGLWQFATYIKGGHDEWQRVWTGGGWHLSQHPATWQGTDQASVWWRDILEAEYDLTEFYMNRYDHRRLDLW